MASIAKRPDGRWRARFRDESGREHSKHFDRKTDAQAWLNGVTASIVVGQYADPRAGRITLRTFYAGWSERQIWVPGTRRSMELAMSTCPFADIELRRIRRSHVESWVREMDRRPLAPSTVGHRVRKISAVLRAAVLDKVISSNPVDGVRLPRQRKAAAAMLIPTPEQVGQVIAAATAEFAPFISVCAFAGLRLGETAGLQVGDIDWLRRTITVSRQVQREPKVGFEVRPPKFGSERVVYVPSGLVETLAEHVRTTGREGWLFTGETGTMPLHQGTVGHRWRTTLKAAGLGGFRLHDLRHFFASGLIAAGCDVVTVQRALGHGSATVTLATYSHLWPTAEDRTRRAAEGIMSAALGVSADSMRTGGEG
jgi:integrase